MDTVNTFSLARQYAKRGLAVFPIREIKNGFCRCNNPHCSSPGKHPQIRDWTTAATVDEQKINEWEAKWPNAGIGILTGKTSDIFVIDVDGSEGEQTLRHLIDEHGSLPETLTVKTGNGRHLYFKHPGQHVKNSTAAIGPGVDVRGDRGFVVSPPSRHANGSIYRWEGDPNLAPARAPSWLVDMVTNTTSADDAFFSSESSLGEEDVRIPVGKRNTTLTSIGGQKRSQGESREEIENTLMVVNATNCVEPLPEAEVRKIAASVARYPAGSPPKRMYWYPLNVDEWSADPNLVLMRDYQIGWSICLDNEAWKRGGVLPSDPDVLWRLARASSRKKFQKEGTIVLSAFDEDIDPDGRPLLVHRRLAALWKKSHQKCRANSANGLKGARVRYGKENKMM